MKAMKKILATTLCLCMILSCVSMIAFAAGENKGSISIVNPTTSEATVAGKTFNLYRIFYASTAGASIAYSWYADPKTPVVNPFYEFFATVEDANGDPLVTAGKAPAEYDNIQKVVDYINENHNSNYALSVFAEQIHDYIAANTAKFSDVVISKSATTGETSVTFDSLPFGYYLVYDVTDFGTSGTSMVRSAVMVDTVDTDISITLKANRPELAKQVLENNGSYGEATSSEIGETVTFKVTTHVPSHEYYKTKYNYYITDELPAGLSLNTDSIEVSIEGVADADIEDYCTIESNEADNSFSVTMKQTAMIGADKLATNTEIVVTYTADVTEEISLGRTVNTATLHYSNDPNEPDKEGSTTDDASVYTYMFVLTKFAIDETNAVSATDRLAGAKFQIYSVDENGVETLLKFIETPNPFVSGKVMYTLDPSNTVGAIDEIQVLDGEAIPNPVRNADYYGGGLGDITIFGLKEGTYKIVETVAPAGFILPTNGFEITISDTIDANGNISILNATVGAHTGDGAIGKFGGETTTFLTWLDIGNRAGSVLPETGGMGTTIFTVLGIILMAGAVAFFTSRKRSSVA